jgi:hypothetical protein
MWWWQNSFLKFLWMWTFAWNDLISSYEWKSMIVTNFGGFHNQTNCNISFSIFDPNVVVTLLRNLWGPFNHMIHSEALKSLMLFNSVWLTFKVQFSYGFQQLIHHYLCIGEGFGSRTFWIWGPTQYAKGWDPKIWKVLYYLPKASPTWEPGIELFYEFLIFSFIFMVLYSRHYPGIKFFYYIFLSFHLFLWLLTVDAIEAPLNCGMKDSR